MNRPPSFRIQEHQQESGGSRQEAGPLEFATPEELIRHDARQTPTPPALTQRVGESVARQPAVPRPWWRRLFGS